MFPRTLVGLWGLLTIGLFGVLALDGFLETERFLNIYFYVVPALGACWYVAKWLRKRREQNREREGHSE